MILLYLDESRHEDPNSWMVVAGFWGTPEQWAAFEPDWTVALGQKRALHMNTLRLNSVRGGRRAKVQLKRLGDLPYKHGLKGIYGAVRAGDYLDVVANTYLEVQLPGYAICLTAVMQKLSRTVPPHESIKIVCEIQTSYEKISRQSFENLRRTDPISSPLRPYFHSIEFIRKNFSVRTQPCDFLAYALAEWFEDRDSRKSQLCRPIFGATGVSGLRIPPAEIRQMALNVKNGRMFRIITGK
jgi:hypothetical protein